MSKTTPLTQKNQLKVYSDLLIAIRSEINKSRKDIELRKAQAYWVIGSYINLHLLKNKIRVERNTRLYKNLVRDTGIDERTIQRLVKFSREFSKPAPGSDINWSAYREFLAIKNHPTRLQLIRKSRREGLNIRAIRKEVAAIRFKEKGVKKTVAPTKILKSAPGKIHTYQIIEPDMIKAEVDTKVVDCGFKIWRQVPCLPLLNKKSAGDFVQSTVKETWFELKNIEATKKDLYTYRAFCERVVDGDTVIFQIDLGFRTWIRQYLRLRGIDAPELRTKPGKRSKDFLHRLFKDEPYVIIKTHQADIYGRYLTDIFDSRGRYVNQLLVDKGYAEFY